jgi:hypothetical protein
MVRTLMLATVLEAGRPLTAEEYDDICQDCDTGNRFLEAKVFTGTGPDLH